MLLEKRVGKVVRVGLGLGIVSINKVRDSKYK
jgi:hypothetical protein